MNKLLKSAGISLFLALSSSANATLQIVFDFSTIPAGDQALSATNQGIFNTAKAFWESEITGYQDGSTTRTLNIQATGFSQAASGGGVLLGSAGPNNVTRIFGPGGVAYAVPTTGAARFNVHPDAVGAGGTLNLATIIHEVGHILGIGTLWDTTGLGDPAVFGATQNVYTDGTGQYTGARALAGYRGEFDPSAAFVPVELDGGPGTANGHWNERLDHFSIENQLGQDSQPGDNILAAPTVRFGPNAGKSLDDGIMTGTLGGAGAEFLSDTSLGGFQDIGYTTVAFRSVNASAAVPEPSGVIFAFTGLGALMLRRKRA